MKHNYRFLLELLRTPKNIGAIFPSSKFLAKQMIKNISFNNDINIIEYGAGTGVFTDKIIKQMSNNSKLIIIENNPFFL